MIFKENDFITLSVNGQSCNYIVSDKNIPGLTVSLYFANNACKREIIEKWIPKIGEECFFYDMNNQFVIDLFNGFEEMKFDNSKYFISKKNHILKNEFFNNKNIFEFCGSIEEEFEETNVFKYCEPYIGQTIPFNLKGKNLK